VSPVRNELGFYIPKDGILHSHRRENLKSYVKEKMFLRISPRSVCGTNNLTATPEPIVYRMWDPQHHTTVHASTACYGDDFTCFIYYN
jgi:hypothetical protein